MISSSFFSDAPATSRPATSRDNRAASPNPAKAHDAELVRRFNAGDDSAFVEIVSRYRGRMFAIGLSLLRNHGDAEEIAQDTFIRAHRALAHFRGDSSLATWLHRIAFNLSRNRYWYFFRRQRHETRSLDCARSDGSDSTFADVIASEFPDPLRETVNREFSEHMAECMGKLNAHQREILTQRNLLDRSYEEIAQSLGISMGTVKSRIARARKNLRALLAQTYAGTDSGEPFSTDWFGPNRPSGCLNAACG